ncbi:MAG: hypothetical protein HS117_23085 [Verrucomicrobiaceae bacterium]|nr:hypothetical protein [Verrucomicrobiaceae bacterium]
MRSSFSFPLQFWVIQATLMAMTCLHAAPGDLDTSFGAGLARHTLGGDDQARGVHVFPDGSMLVGGLTDRSTGNYDFTLTRFSSGGLVDASFGTSGTVRTEVGTGNDRVRDMLRLSDGRILLAGDSRNASNYDLALVCHQAGGSLDTTFGNGGKAVVSISSRDDFLSRVIESDGKILAVGYTYTDGGSPTGGDDLVVVRWNANGSLDTSFNGTGYLVLDIFAKPEYGRAIHVLQNGDILVLGEVLTGSNRDAFLVKLNSSGQIVTSFNGTGHVLIDQAQAPEIAFDMKVQTDGKILMAGWRNTGSGNDFALARYEATGVPDITFNNTGFVTTSLSKTGAEADQAYAIALQADGRIIVVGSASGGGAMGVVRYMPDGTLDGTFNSNGYFLIDGTPMPGLNANGNLVIPVGTSAQLRDVMLLADGGLVAVGQAHNGVNNDLLVTRLDSSGKLDSSFGGTSGKVTTSINSGSEVIHDIAIAADGKVVAVGHGQNGATRDFTVARYLRNGFLDVTFGTNGKVQTPIGSGDDDAEAVAIDSVGRIVVAGHALMPGNGWDFAVVRYNADGTLDTGFGSAGKVTTKIGDSTSDDYARSIVIAPDGKILVAGEALNKEKTNYKFQIVRYNSNGTLDTSFGTDSQRPGVATASFGSGYELPRKIILEPGASPKIIVAGHKSGNGGHDIALARFNYNGTLDTSFELDGMVSVDIGGRDDVIQSVIRQSDGRIVVGGHASSGGNYSFLQVGFNTSGNLDNSFDTDAVVLVPGGSGGALGFAMAVQPDNKIVMAGASISSSEDFGLFRVQANGALDSGFGSAGQVVTPIGGSNDRAYACVIQPDGKIIAAGHAWNGSNDDFALVRYMGNTPVVTATAATNLGKFSAQINGAVTPNGIPVTIRFEHGPTTAYGQSTPAQAIGISPATQNVNAMLSGLVPNTTYHYRLVAYNGVEDIYGADMTFTTLADPPVAYTLTAADIGPTSASLIGIVIPGTFQTTVWFEYGTTTDYGQTTASEVFAAGTDFRSLTKGISGLSLGVTYHYRIVASSFGGITYGVNGTFTTQASSTTPEAAPVVTTGAASSITTTSADVSRAVNPRYGTTFAWFEYGTTTAYGNNTLQSSIGNGGEPVLSQQTLTGLLPGTLYYYRAVASNGLGTTYGTDMTFTTQFLPPVAVTGGAVAVGTTGATLHGTVNANNAATTVSFDYSTDGGSTWSSVPATPSPVTGSLPTTVTASLTNLSQFTTYHYRVKAERPGIVTTGIPSSFQVATLSGLQQVFPTQPAPSAGTLTVHLTPAAGVLTGWRLAGEQGWRASGSSVTGLTAWDRGLEFRPAPGYIQPPGEIIAFSETEITRDYYLAAGSGGGGGLSVTLMPAGITEGAGRAQWRLLGEGEAQWRDSGSSIMDLIPGSYLIECKPVTGRSTPMNTSVIVSEGQVAAPTITYFQAYPVNGTPGAPLDFSAVSTDTTKPYAYAGQIRSHAGSSSGFVVKPRVVATAAHVVFDDGRQVNDTHGNPTLATVQGLQWLLQRHAGVHEPEPLVPRGFYAFTGYAAQRISDNSPGTSSAQSQHLDVAALYFNENAGRDGFSGFLASDLTQNEFLTSSAHKTLVGYPVDGIASEYQGIMHATSAANVSFTAGFGRTFTTTGIRGSGGGSGGPLCVQHNGIWYPAAIFLGGSNQTVVRAIDSEVIDLFNRAQISGNGGANNTSGGITTTSYMPITGAATGTLKVNIEPAGAVNAGARWGLAPEVPQPFVGRISGGQRALLTPKTLPDGYILHFATVNGYDAPASQSVPVAPGYNEITFRYNTFQESWRHTYFGTTANSGDAADNHDYDRDGFTNAEEYAAGTNPVQRGDFFRANNPQHGPGTFSVSTAGKAGRSYILERSATMAAGTWSTVDTEGPLAADGPVTLTDAASPSGTAFYRIRVTGP